MKYVIEKKTDKEKKPVGYIIWEETDFPKKELLKHPVPKNYKGTSESKYLLELFELSWSNGDYVPQGYLPLYNRLPLGDTDKANYEITPFKDLDYTTATRIIFQSVFHRFGIKYYNTAFGDEVFNQIDKMGIPFLAHKEIIPQDIDSVYYFALLFKHELFSKISSTGILEILKQSETKKYPKDSNGYLSIDSLIKFSKAFQKTHWVFSPNNKFYSNKTLSWVPQLVDSQHWQDFYEIFNSYESKGFIEISKHVSVDELKVVMKIAELFEITDYNELIELYKNAPKEWLANFNNLETS